MYTYSIYEDNAFGEPPTLSGYELIAEYGKRGSILRRISKGYSFSRADAKFVHDALVEEKLAKDYVIVKISKRGSGVKITKQESKVTKAKPPKEIIIEVPRKIFTDETD